MYSWFYNYLYNNLKNINHTIIKNNNNDNNECFICFNNVDYYIMFDCECHNYLHINCVNNKKLTKCCLCRKKITKIDLSNDEYKIFIIDYELLDCVCKKTNVIYILDEMIGYMVKNPNFMNIGLYFIMCICFIFGIILPIAIYSIFSKCYKIFTSKLYQNHIKI